MLKKGFGNFIMNNNKEFLATEPIEKLLLRLAIPTLAAQMINMLYNIIDRIYIGHIPGSGALAPVSYTHLKFVVAITGNIPLKRFPPIRPIVIANAVVHI